MALQEAKERKLPSWQVFPVIETVAGFGHAQNLMALSDPHSTVVTGSSLYSNAMIGVSLGGTYFAGASDYDPDFVTSILQSDAAAPEANFNNVVDMLDLL